MSKAKKTSVITRLTQTMKFSAKYIVIALMLVLFAYFTIEHFGSSSSSVIGLAPDRSEAYNVKVLPASLSDEELNTLTRDAFSYLAMIDAGSSGCRAHVYRFGKLGSITGPLYVLPEHKSLKVKPGLSTFAKNPQDAGPSIKGLVDFMKEQVPEADWATTPIWLKATAGLRMLPSAESEEVLNSIRSFLGNREHSPFLFRPTFARIIPGNEEGGFGWIAFNYLKRIIGPKRDPASAETPYAVVEMGGASSQVSQLAPTPAAAAALPAQYRFSFTIEKDTYELYTHSYLGFGAEQGREQLNRALASPITSAAAAAAASGSPAPAATVADPCLNTGYSRPSDAAITEPYQGPEGLAVAGAASAASPGEGGGGGQCVNSLANIFKYFCGVMCGISPPASTPKQEPACDPVTQPGPYSFGCVHQPDFIAASPNFLAFENFYYMASAIAVKPVGAAAGASPATTSFPLLTTPSNILEASNAMCATEWTQVVQSYPLDNQPKDVNLKMCFSSSYAYSFLVDGLKIDKHKPVTIQKEVGKSEIEWALGAAYKEAAELLKRTNLRPT
jgi:Golgi nucleoside diphosphatase